MAKLLAWRTGTIRKQITAVAVIQNRLMNMHRAARFMLHGAGHEGGVDVMAKRRLPNRAFEQKSLVSQLQRCPMHEIDFNLCGPGFVIQRINVNRLRFTEIVNIFKNRIKFVNRIDAIRLACCFRPAIAANRRL